MGQKMQFSARIVHRYAWVSIDTVVTITKTNVSDYHVRFIDGPRLAAMEMVGSYVNTTNPEVLPC